MYIAANFWPSHSPSWGYLPNVDSRTNILHMRSNSNAVMRIVCRAQIHATEQLWDTREVATGTYTVVIMNAGHELRTEKLIVKQ